MSRYLFAALVLVPSLTAAQDSGVEITPFAGYRMGGSFQEEGSDSEYELRDSSSFGLILNFRHRDPTQWEIFYSQQQTEAEFQGAAPNDPLVDIDIHVLQLGGTYRGEGEKARPYLAATIGGTHIRASSAASSSDTFFSGSIGVGMMIMPRSRVGIRVEARAYGTLVNSDTNLFCSTGPNQNICAVQIEGSMLTQIETFVGITFRF